MNCAKFESDIALYAGGDLPSNGVARVEEHIAQCGHCRILMEELRAGRTLLAELRDDPIEDAMLARVRRNVLAQVAAPRPSRLYWKLALAAALVLAVVLGWPRHRPVLPVRVARVQAPRLAPTPPVQAVPVRRPIVRKHRRAPAAAQPAGEPLLVQFVTGNPDIVIYWLVDQKPQGD